MKNIDFGIFPDLIGHYDYVNRVCYSPDGKTIASCSSDNTIKLWNSENGKEKTTFYGHQDTVRGICYSPNGNTIASCSDDETIKLWNSENGKEIITLYGHCS